MIILTVAFLIVVPINASPSDVVLDKQVELEVPGKFILIDTDKNQKAEAIQFEVAIKAYRQNNMIVTGNLQAVKNGEWTAVATTVIPFQWSQNSSIVKLVFYPGEIQKSQLSGPYRISITLEDGEWVLPEQIAGMSPSYSWSDFENKGNLNSQDEISSSSQAKRAAEAWANLNQIKLGQFINANYNYDTWNVDYHDSLKGRILRFLISPTGKVRLLKINQN